MWILITIAGLLILLAGYDLTQRKPSCAAFP